MFFSRLTNHRRGSTGSAALPFVGMEGLEGRRMMSAAPLTHHAAPHRSHKAPTVHHTLTKAAPAKPAPAPAPVLTTILFSAAPAAVQTGLQSQAPAGVTLDASESVKVCTRPDGSQVYTVEVSNNGTDVYLSVDAKGNPVHLPPPPPPPPPPGTGHGQNQPTILFGAAPTAVQTGLQAQAPAGVTIDPSESVKVCTRPDGTMIYIIEVSNNGKDDYLAVDASGHAVPPPPPPPPPPGGNPPPKGSNAS